MRRGRLVALEGIDGAGTSTQGALLTRALVERDFACMLTHEPSDGPVGMLIRQILSHRIVVPTAGGGRPPRMETMALLFAADRVDHVETQILPNLRDGITVICDRYLHSSIAYQTLTSTDDEEAALGWVTTVNAKALPPDLVLVLDLPAEEAARRRRLRGGVEEMYDNDSLQDRLADFYGGMSRRFPDQPIEIIDGARTVEEVHRSCLDAVLARLEGKRECPA